MEEKVIFAYSVFAESLEKQANDQGYTLGKDAEMFEKIKKGIHMCGFHVANELQVKSMVQKLHNKVIKALKTIAIKE
jgi:hypothetical protein